MTSIHILFFEQKVLQFRDDVSLLALGVGSTAGVRCNSDGTLYFFLDITRLQIKLPPSLKMPQVLYGVIDLYGQCTAVELLPLDRSPISSSLKLSFEVDVDGVQPVLEELARKKESKRRTSSRDSERDTVTTQQLLPSIDSPLNSHDITPQPVSQQYSQAVPSLSEGVVSRHRPPVYGQSICPYRELCQRFLNNQVMIKGIVHCISSRV